MFRFGLWVALFVALALSGCSGQGEKGVNKDKDRPKVEEKRPAE